MFELYIFIDNLISILCYFLCVDQSNTFNTYTSAYQDITFDYAFFLVCDIISITIYLRDGWCFLFQS